MCINHVSSLVYFVNKCQHDLATSRRRSSAFQLGNGGVLFCVFTVLNINDDELGLILIEYRYLSVSTEHADYCVIIDLL